MKFLIAGFGSIGRRHFRNLQELGQKNIVLLRSGRSTLDTDETEGFPVEHDLEVALAHKPDAIIIATPTSTHLDIAIPAAKAGVHILLEKPISFSMERVDDLKQAAQESGVRILIGFQFRFHPGLLRMKAMIDSGEFGRPIQARAFYCEHLPDWHPWEDYKQSYSARADLGGGATLTLSHPFDYLHWLIGHIDEVSGMVGNNQVLGIDADEQAQALLRFDSGALGLVQVDYLQKPTGNWVEVQCERGFMVCDFITHYYKQYSNEVGELEEFRPAPDFDRNTLFLDQTRHFIEIVDGKAEPNSSLDDGMHALEVALAVQESNQSGQHISLA